MTNTIASLIKRAEGSLAKMSDSAHLDAEVLLAHVLGKPRSFLRAWPAQEISETALAQFQLLLARRIAGEPVAYLTGQREFWSLALQVNRHTLIPRPETELLVEFALQRIPQNVAWRIADLATGCGAIALALACQRPQCQLIATDISPDALVVARHNAEHHGLANVEFRQGSWFEPLAGERFDFIVSNPPYIREGDPHLNEGDLRYEPTTALVAGPSGLEALQAIVLDANKHLHAGGWLALEHGYDQADAVAMMLRELGYSTVAHQRDYAGVGRITVGQSPREIFNP